MEEKFYVKIKDDFGVVREFEVATAEMKIAIDNTKKTFKEQKFNFLGKEYSVRDMFNIVGEFLEPLCNKQEKN